MCITQGLCAHGTDLYAAWKGEVGDSRLFFSVFNGTSWNGEGNVIPGNSSVGPSLAATSNGLIYAAWKGEDDDARLFYATYNVSTKKWATQVQIAGTSSFGPSLAAIGNTVYAGWSGNNNDQNMSFASFDASNSTWPSLPGISGASSVFGPSLAAVGNTLYAAWMDYNGHLSSAAFDISTGKWSTPVTLGDVGSSIGPSLGVAGSTLYAVWKGEGNDQGLYYASFDASTQKWSGQTQIAKVSSSIGAALAGLGTTLYAMFVGPGTDVSLYYATLAAGASAWSGQTAVSGNTGQDMVPPPVGGLGSSYNYLLCNNCEPITNLSVTMIVTEEIVVKSGGGFSFQLNAYSPQSQICDWQQYIVNFNIGTLAVAWQIDNWPEAGGDNLINSGIITFASLKTAKVPVGTGFSIALANDGKNNVTSVVFGVCENTANMPWTKTPAIELSNQYVINPTTGNATTTKIPSTYLAPIIAFELDITGPDESSVTFSSGAGTIAYSAPQNALAPLSSVPACVEYFGGTAETSNAFCAMLPPSASKTITQTFGTNTASVIMAAAPKTPRRTTPSGPKKA